MKVTPNPKRLVLLIALCLIPVAGIWLVEMLKRSRPILSLPALDQRHTVAVAALVLIAIVGLAKLWIRRR